MKDKTDEEIFKEITGMELDHFLMLYHAKILKIIVDKTVIFDELKENIYKKEHRELWK